MRGPGHNGDEHGHGDGSKIGDDNIGLAEHHQGGGYYYRRDRVLTTQADAKEVFEVVNRRFANKKRPAPDYDSDPKPLYRGSRVVVVPMDPARFDRVAVPEIVGELRSEHRARGPLGVAPDHVLSLASHPDPFPANAPQSGTGLARVGARAGSALGKGVNVAVFDSGVDRANAILGPRLDSATGASDDEDPVGATLGRYSGHGTFVAGLVLQQAPMATICARKAFGEDGFVTDSSLAALLRARMPDNVDIVNLSCGGPTHDNMGMPAVEEWLGRFRNSHPTTVVIAAGGNDGVGVPYFPAAFKGVIGVAATTEKKREPASATMVHGSTPAPRVSTSGART
jgi:subtilisin family serine protease